MKGVSKSTLAGYKEGFKIDLVNNKKEMALVNGLAIGTMVLMFLGVFLKYSPKELYEAMFQNEPKGFYLLVAVFILVYMAAHEAVHGIAMKFFTDQKLRYGYTVVYAYAGSMEGLFNVKEYIVVALAPLVTFCILFWLCGAAFPNWFLLFYILQIMNVSGSMGDVYVTCRMLKHLHEDLLVNDTGTDMTTFVRE